MGYIIPEFVESTLNSMYRQVKCFKEKPTQDQAELFIEQDALWNCGVFAFKLDFLISMLEKNGYPIYFEELLMQYDRLPNISFDFEVVEKSNKIVVVPFNGEWKELGTWDSITEEMNAFAIGKGIISEDSANTHLINELDIPVTIVGLSNVVVAASPDGILVADKTESPRIKELMKDVEQRQMYEERIWGWSRVVDYKKFKEYEVLTRRICILAGRHLNYQVHQKLREIWIIISGMGEVTSNGDIRRVEPGDVLQISVDTKHYIKAITEIEFIKVQKGIEMTDEDSIQIPAKKLKDIVI